MFRNNTFHGATKLGHLCFLSFYCSLYTFSVGELYLQLLCSSCGCSVAYFCMTTSRSSLKTHAELSNTDKKELCLFVHYIRTYCNTAAITRRGVCKLAERFQSVDKLYTTNTFKSWLFQPEFRTKSRVLGFTEHIIKSRSCLAIYH